MSQALLAYHCRAKTSALSIISSLSQDSLLNKSITSRFLCLAYPCELSLPSIQMSTLCSPTADLTYGTQDIFSPVLLEFCGLFFNITLLNITVAKSKTIKKSLDSAKSNINALFVFVYIASKCWKFCILLVNQIPEFGFSLIRDLLKKSSIAIYTLNYEATKIKALVLWPQNRYLRSSLHLESRTLW